MDIIYVDPGYGKGMTTNGTLTTVESEEYNPINGVAFTGNNCYALIPLTQYLSTPSSSSVYDFYFSYKFSVYCQDMASAKYFMVGSQLIVIGKALK